MTESNPESSRGKTIAFWGFMVLCGAVTLWALFGTFIPASFLAVMAVIRSLVLGE